MKTAVAWYCLVIGVMMAAWWANDLRQGAWNRGDRTHGELALHLAAEFVTAALLIAAGAARLAAGPAANAVMAASLGMLLYTVIASPGYFLARRELPVVGLFGILATLTVTALAVVLA